MIALLLAMTVIRPSLEEWKHEVLCWESGYCQERVVNLGPWDPRPTTWTY